jgi:hypothetical protein
VTTHRRYYFIQRGGYPDNAHGKVLEVLERWCERRWWYTDPVVEGSPFGRLVFSISVAGRDQWWCHRRAMWLAVKCYRAVHLTLSDLPVPDWEELAPHMNRGRGRKSTASQESQSSPA